MIKAFVKNIINKHSFFLILVVSIFIFFVINGIHGSSLGEYYKYFYGNTLDKSLLLFETRSIRSDEWLVSSPLAISQSFSNWSVILPFQGYGSKLIAMLSVPALSFKSFFHPNMWGYFFLPLEQAFAFSWWFNDLILLVFTYLFFMIITKRKILISVTFSLAILFSPFVQWWRGAAIATPAFGFAILYFTLIIFNYKKVINLVSSTFLLIYFLICYLFILYPPFQISFAFCMLFFLIGYFLQYRTVLTKQRVFILFIVVMCITASIGMCLKSYIYKFNDVITLVKNTSYPGERIVSHGNYPAMQFFNGFYNMQFLDDVKGSASFGNQSEGSSFFMISFFLIPLFLIQIIHAVIKKKHLDFIYIFLFLSLLVVTAVVFIPLPKCVYSLILLNLVADNRLILGIGSINLILLGYFITYVKPKKNKLYGLVSMICAISALLANSFIGFLLKKNYPLFIQSNIKIIFISLVAGFLVYFVALGKRKLFCILLLFITFISSYRINPFYRGLNALINIPFAREIKDIKNNDKNARWVVYDNIILSNYLIANGISTISGTYIYPQAELLAVFDKQGEYKGVWNRYAHIVFNETHDLGNPVFRLNQPDSYSIIINPCSSLFKKIGVQYFVFSHITNEYTCLKKIKELSYPGTKIVIYKN